MSINFTPVNYVDNETVIGAKNLNDIQEAIINLDANKVEKEQGKGLSTNDYTNAEKEKVANAYVVPAGGIPKSTLAESVQTSLGKADTALQSEALQPYRTAAAQDVIDNLQNEKIDVAKRASNLFDEYLEGTTQTVNFLNDKPSSIVHTKNGSAVRTDSFSWGANSVTETRTLADGTYITIATNLDTLVSVISEIQEGT